MLVISAGERLRRRERTRALGSLLLALVSVERGYREAAWDHFQHVPVALWSRHAVQEYVLAGIAADRKAVVAGLLALAGEPSPQVSAAGWFEASSRVFGLPDPDAARVLFERFDRAVEETAAPDKTLVQNRDWLRGWIALDPTSPTAPGAPAGHVTFAVMDYGHPGRARASANIGDHVQSIASLGHVVRRKSLTFHGERELVDLMNRLGERVPEPLRIDGAPADVDVLTVHRDASMYSPIPENTWTLGFGWFMHPIYEARCGFPFHDNLLPIFVSFHCSKRELLTDDAVAYLKRFGPIGCRDWTTVDILLSMGVPAFFSGCMTTTVSTVFPVADRSGADRTVAYVDMPPESVPAGATTYKHSDDAIRFRSFERNIDDAVDLLETYRGRHDKIVTSRLHAYLPSRSLGVEVDFQPKNRSDPRFEGLIAITDEQFESIRTGIMEKLDAVLGLIFTGASAETVFALWNDLTAPEVEQARARHSAPARTARLDASVSAAAGAAAAALMELRPRPATGSGDPVEVVVHVGSQQPAGLSRNLPVLVGSVVQATRRPVHVTLISRLEPAVIDPTSWSPLAPGAGLSVLSTAGLSESMRRRTGRAVPSRDLDLALLPLLLPSTGRVVILPGTAVARADLGALADLDLGAHRIGAATTRGTRSASGFGVIHTAAGRLRNETAPAAELRRVAHARHAFDFDSLTTSVMVWDLAGLRADDFVAEFVPYIGEFDLGLRELLCLYAGPDRAEVIAEWDVVPTRDSGIDVRLAHWADPLKPWETTVVPGAELWQESRAALSRT